MSTTTEYQADEPAAEVGRDPEWEAAGQAEQREQLRLITERQTSIDTRLDELMRQFMDAEQLRSERDSARAEIARMQTQAVDPEKLIALYAALAEFQVELPKIEKTLTATVRSDKGTYKYDYADLATVAQAVLPLLGKHGLAWITMPRIDTRLNIFGLRWILAHKDGGTLQGDYPLPDPRQDAQKFGGQLTYARRYLLLAVTGTFPAGEDDDAVAATGRQVSRDPYGDGDPYSSGGSAPQAPPSPPARRSPPAKAAQGSSSPQSSPDPHKAAQSHQGSIDGNLSPLDQAKKRAQAVVGTLGLSWGEFADQYKRFTNDENARWQTGPAGQLVGFLDMLEAQQTALAGGTDSPDSSPS